MSTHKDDQRPERPPSPPAAGSVLPCPFCGTDVGDSGCTHYPDREEHYVWCSHCCTQSGRYQTRRQAIAAWNHRVPVSPNDRTERQPPGTTAACNQSAQETNEREN